MTDAATISKNCYCNITKAHVANMKKRPCKTLFATLRGFNLDNVSKNLEHHKMISFCLVTTCFDKIKFDETNQDIYHNIHEFLLQRHISTSCNIKRKDRLQIQYVFATSQICCETIHSNVQNSLIETTS
jgi:hypothetical protein